MEAMKQNIEDNHAPGEFLAPPSLLCYSHFLGLKGYLRMQGQIARGIYIDAAVERLL